MYIMRVNIYACTCIQVNAYLCTYIYIHHCMYIYIYIYIFGISLYESAVILHSGGAAESCLIRGGMVGVVRHANRDG